MKLFLTLPDCLRCALLFLSRLFARRDTTLANLTRLVVILFVACGATSCASLEAEVGSNAGTQTTELVRGEVLNRSYFFAEAGKEQTYALYIPTTYDASKQAPLVVLLHGLRSNPNQIMRYQGLIPEAEKRGTVLVAPYGYNERGWYGSRGQGKEGIAFGKASDPENLGELSEKDVMNVLGIVRDELSIDSDRIFLCGHSMGGGGALHLAATYPDQWAGLACLAPSFQGPVAQLEQLKHLPVLVITGDKDRLVRVADVRRWVDAMQLLKMDVRYDEIKGGGHFGTITRNPEMIAEVFDFFNQHTR